MGVERMSDKSMGSRLPPPAFPPGSRKQARDNDWNQSSADALGEGFISPDEPMPERHDQADDAFISPDEPIPHRDPVEDESGLPEFESAGGVVTGMGDDEHIEPEELVMGGDPYVMDLAQKVGKLAEALKGKGEAGLRSSPDMDKFETTLRGYCVGYLAGRRVEDDASGADF